MCTRCESEIDYPVADCWRPCYIPTGRTHLPQDRSKRIPPTPRGGFSDEDYDAQHKINQLMAIIRSQRTEISTLKAISHRTDSRDSFEGVE